MQKYLDDQIISSEMSTEQDRRLVAAKRGINYAARAARAGVLGRLTPLALPDKT